MAYGDIGSVLDTLEFDLAFASYCRVVRVNDTIALIFYCDTDGKQHVCTVEVNAAGAITDTLKDSLIWTDVYCGYCSICKRADDMFVCGYRGAVGGSPGEAWLSTISVSALGAIPAATTDDGIADATYVTGTSVIQLLPSLFVVGTKNASNNGQLFTMIISEAGAITTPPEDNFQFAAGIDSPPHICKVSDSVIAVVYSDGSSHGQLFTIGVTSLGDIDAGTIDTFGFDLSACDRPRICHVSGDIYAIAYRGPGTEGRLITVTIDSAGEITEPVEDSFTFEASTANHVFITKISDSIVAVVYEDGSSHGQLFTIGINAAGDIDASKIDFLEYEDTFSSFQNIIHMQGDIYLVVYQGPDTDGFCKSVDISTPVAGGAHHEMIMGMGP